MAELFDRFARDFLGLDATTTIVRVDGSIGTARRTYLDSAATCLMPKPSWKAVTDYLQSSCANSHTESTTAAVATTRALERTHALLGQLVGYDPQRDCVILTGSGATGPLNLLAHALMRDPSRPIAIVSSQEHHSNFLPWIQAAGETNVRFVETLPDGTIDLSHLARLLNENRGRIRIVAVTALSNVTGVINPVNRIAEMAHAAGAEIVVDAAQAAAHIPVAMHPSQAGSLDYVAMSGHKLYAPGSPGVIVGRRDLFNRCGWKVGQVGGGTVDYVGLDGATFKTDPTERQEAGTPNIPGTIGLGVSVGILEAIGLDTIRSHEMQLLSRVIDQLRTIPRIVIYGPKDVLNRAAVVSFNIGPIPHGLVNAALNDYFGIAVRHHCFCAQPYVRSLIYSACEVNGYCEPVSVQRRGMVRASIGVYSTLGDVDQLVQALRWIEKNEAWVAGQYHHDGKGHYTHKTFNRPLPFSLEQQITSYVGNVAPAGQIRSVSSPSSAMPLSGAISGAAIGGAVGGPIGALAGGVVGIVVGVAARS